MWQARLEQAQVDAECSGQTPATLAVYRLPSPPPPAPQTTAQPRRVSRVAYAHGKGPALGAAAWGLAQHRPVPAALASRVACARLAGARRLAPGPEPSLLSCAAPFSVLYRRRCARLFSRGRSKRMLAVNDTTAMVARLAAALNSGHQVPPRRSRRGVHPVKTFSIFDLRLSVPPSSLAVSTR